MERYKTIIAGILLLFVAAYIPACALGATKTPQAFLLTEPSPAGPTPRTAEQTSSATNAADIQPMATPQPTDIPQPSETPIPESIRFAVIGDFGEGNQAEEDVANLVKSWDPDFILTTGDNNYPSGAAETIDHRVGSYYHDYIYPYLGAYGAGADQNRFFPTMGNHDWDTARAQAYLDYFTLPGNERYYDFLWGPVHFIALDSDSREPDGVSRTSPQAQWLQARLGESQSLWKVVFMHHPPYTSGLRGPVDWMHWPFKEWGADVVLTGHDHFYERLVVDGLPYFINGLGGGPIYGFGFTANGSQFRYSVDYGAMLVTADSGQMNFQFINRIGEVIDVYQILR